MKPPMSFALGAAVLLIIGLAGEWAQSVIPVSWQVANTGVAWGDTHFALLGAGVLGGFAGLYYWFPKLCGRYLGESLGRGSLRLIVLGAVLMVIPMQLAGLKGMPVDVYKYYADTGMSVYNLIASIGAFALAIGIILTLINVAASWNGGTPAGPDPWDGTTLEWFAPSPPPVHNFDVVPDVRSSEPYRDIREAVRRHRTEVVLPDATIADPAPEPVAVGAGGAETAAEPAEGTADEASADAVSPEPPAGEAEAPGEPSESSEGDESGEGDGPLA